MPGGEDERHGPRFERRPLIGQGHADQTGQEIIATDDGDRAGQHSAGCEDAEGEEDRPEAWEEPRFVVCEPDHREGEEGSGDEAGDELLGGEEGQLFLKGGAGSDAAEDHLGGGGNPQEIQRDRHDHHGADRKQYKNDGEKRECERDEVELDEAALFRFVVDQIERIEERFDSSIGAPQGHQQTDNESDAERRSSLRGDTRDLIAHHLDSPARNDAGDAVEVRRDGRGIGEQAIERNERGDCGKQRQYRIERHSGGDDDNAVLADVLPYAEQDIFPSADRHFR